MPNLDIVALADEDRSWANDLIMSRHAGDIIYTRGSATDSKLAEGFVAKRDGKAAGVLLYVLGWSDTQILTLEMEAPDDEVARALVERAVKLAKDEDSKAISVTLWNDNIDAMRYFQLAGFRLSSVKKGAVTDARRKNPAIPKVGKHSIPLLDEIELKLSLNE